MDKPYEKMTVPELKAALKAAGLTVTVRFAFLDAPHPPLNIPP